MKTLREINLKEEPEFVEQYIQLRNSYTDMLLTQPVMYKQTGDWLKKNKEVEVRGLADSGGNLLGIIILYLFRAGEIAICVNAKQQGVGTRLLVMIEKIARDHALDSVWAWVLNENTAARRFFEKNGYVKEANSIRRFQNKMREGIKYRKVLTQVQPQPQPVVKTRQEQA